MTFAASMDPDQAWPNIIVILLGVIWIQTIWNFDGFSERVFWKLITQ